VDNFRVVCVSTTNRANQQYCSTEVLIELVKTFYYRAHERRAVEKGKHRIKIFEVAIHQMEHETHFGELEPHRRGLEDWNKPLKAWVSQGFGGI
jgi:hypothetical protein